MLTRIRQHLERALGKASPKTAPPARALIDELDRILGEA
jgi:hypothetical protein